MSPGILFAQTNLKKAFMGFLFFTIAICSIASLITNQNRTTEPIAKCAARVCADSVLSVETRVDQEIKKGSCLTTGELKKLIHHAEGRDEQYRNRD